MLAALVSYLHEQGDTKKALRHVEELAVLSPADRAVQAVLEAVRRQAGAR